MNQITDPNVNQNANANENENESDKENENTNECERTDNEELWKSRNVSKTKYLCEYFDCSKVHGSAKKLNVVCKICETTYSITKGNNSNLMKHLKQVSFCNFFIHKSFDKIA